jgi:hypothetical protein
MKHIPNWQKETTNHHEKFYHTISGGNRQTSTF